MINFEELETLDPRKSVVASTKIDVLTPHKIAVVILVKEYTKAKNSVAEIGLSYQAQSRRRFCMLLLKLIQYPDMTYKDLHNMLTSNKYKIDFIHLDGFEKSMSNLNVMGIEHLIDLISGGPDLFLIVHDIVAHSIVGCYIRRIGVTMDRMSFAEMMALYKNISLYYEKGIRILAFQPRKSLILTSRDSVMDSFRETVEETSFLDTEIVHKDRNSHSKWSVKQADLFIAQQCSLLERNELRALPPIELQSKLNAIIQDNPLLTQAYFLTYMNNLRIREYFGSLDALHRSFDRSPLQASKSETRGFQFFSINLAVLQANFGHREEALSCLKECIMLAQEAGDTQCLDLANSWYCILSSDKIDPFEKSPQDLSDMFIVKIGAQCGYFPLDLMELLQKSDEINCRSSLLENFTDSLALRAALWSLYGKNELSSIHSQLLLKLKKTWVFGDVGNSEGICMVLCNLAIWLNMQGKYAFCAVVLHNAKERFPRYPFSANWMIAQCCITVEQSIHRCKWQDALKACDQLYVFDENNSILHRAKVYVAKRFFKVAQTMINKLLSKKDIEPLIQVRALILLALTQITKDFFTVDVIETLSKARGVAVQSFMELEISHIDVLFAQVLLRMQMPKKALKQVKYAMETIYANSSIYDRAKTYMVYVRCILARLRNKRRIQISLKRCMPMIKESVHFFKRLEAHAKVLDVYCYMSRLHNALGLIEQRNKYARKFKQYHCQYPIPVEYFKAYY